LLAVHRDRDVGVERDADRREQVVTVAWPGTV